MNEIIIKNVVREEIKGTLKNMKAGKASGLDGIVVDTSGKGVISIIF